MAAVIPFIIIAEDEPGHGEAIRRAFRAAGAEAELQVVGTLREYRQALAARPPDIALVDMNLPDGKAMEILTSPPDAGPFPIVVMTSYGNEQMAVQALQAGAIDYVAKSAESFVQMPHTVRRAMDQWELSQKHKREEEEKKRLLAIIEESPDYIGIADLQGNLQYHNSAANRMVGLPEHADLSHLKIRDMHPGWAAKLVEEVGIPTVLRQGVWTGENVLRHQDGREIPVSQVLMIHRDSSGKPQFISTIMRDITERKRAEERHSTVLQTAMDGFWGMDAEGHIIEVNDAFCRLTGYSREELLKMSIANLEAMETPGEMADHIRQVVAAGSDRFETRHRRKDGQVIDVEISVKSMGTPLPWLFVFARDISARKQADEALRESEERFRTLVESVTDYAYKVTVQDGRVVETTHGPGCLGVTGYSPDEFRADPGLWLHMVHPENQRAVLELAAKLSAGLKVGPLEHRIICKNGETRWIRNSTVPRYDRRAQFVGYEGMVQDVTEHRRLLEQFVQAQKMEAIGQLAGGVAHDFRNQLTVIKGYGEMLLRRKLVKDAGKEKLGHILTAADRSATIAGQLLAFSRRQMLQPEVISLGSVTGDMMKSLVQTIGEDIRVSVIPDGDLWNVCLDAGQLQQALLNLVLNARDAMPQGGRLAIHGKNIVLDEGFVRQHADASIGRYVVLSISDTGCGMDSETLGRIFQPFFTTKPVGTGTGLGLAMVYGFVAQSGGFIEVRSQPGEGTTFWLYFPAVADIATHSTQPVQAVDLPQGSSTILVVEDEAAVRRMLSETLGECGYAVLTAANSKEAMVLIGSRKERFDLLITDVVMPGRSGAELARDFQASHPGVPVLLISGHAGKTLSDHGVVPSGVNLLIKPFSAQMLAETVQRILGQPKQPPE